MTTDGDVLIVGGGLAGCIAAVRLSRSGLRVQLVERLVEPLDEFRAEQIVGVQPDRLRALGLLATLTDGVRATHVTGNYRRGRLLDHTRVEQYGMTYRSMVRAARAALAPGCLVSARVVGIETSAQTQVVHLADGRRISTRLVVLATGLMPHLPKSIGIGWDMKSEAHSLCLGFGLHFEDPKQHTKVPLTYYRENLDRKIDYLTLFHMDGAVRANLFCYNRRGDAWTLDFLDRPDAALHASMPGLRKVIGPSRIAGRIDARMNDIKVASNVEKDGIVLIGDAFQTPCPAAGTGIERLLSDIDALERLVPVWFATHGMDASKIAAFYASPAKRAFDAECLRVARYRRDVSTRLDLRWRLHRTRVDLQRGLKRMVPMRGAAFANRPAAFETSDR